MTTKRIHLGFALLLAVVLQGSTMSKAFATPANRAALSDHFGKFLAKPLNSCTTCHLPLGAGKQPDSLENFPHNSFGSRLAAQTKERFAKGLKTDLPSRLNAIANEDSDKDGVDNFSELLLGRNPGDKNERPTVVELRQLPQRKLAFQRFLNAYQWRPFESLNRPNIPIDAKLTSTTNPIDVFLAVEQKRLGLKPRPIATKSTLIRRLYVDLVGLVPTPAEVAAFEADKSPNAYQKVVEKLLASPRYGERWGRHWMDIWRYSDWAGWADGGQIRDSKPHIWRWRDWIVESLNKGKPYDRMVLEMLAADEVAPEDTNALRATGFLVRNFKLLSREQWMEDTLNHTSKAFLGVTLHCAKCHDHIYDPIPQLEYYKVRAIFEPHNVRTDRLPGQPDTNKDGLVRTFDADPKIATYFYPRGDERNPDKSKVIPPGVLTSIGGKFEIHEQTLPTFSVIPEKQPFIIKETKESAEKAVQDSQAALSTAKADKKSTESQIATLTHDLHVAEARLEWLYAVLMVENLEDSGKKDSEEWKQAVLDTVQAQRRQTLAEAESAKHRAVVALDAAKDKPDQAKVLQAKVMEADKALAEARERSKAPLDMNLRRRITVTYPNQTTGRRTAFANWIIAKTNPLTARVAVNHIWAKHFGRGIVESTSDFGKNGRKPSHPQLLDWLATEFMARNWSMKAMHRLIVNSQVYQREATFDNQNAKIDPDNIFLWRMNSRRMEAEAVRDNILFVSGNLDETMGGADIDHNLGLTSKRRSIYLRHAAEKQVEFLSIFDGPSVTECYERRPSVMPQQALALANSELSLRHSRLLARELDKSVGSQNEGFITQAFQRVLSRRPTKEEAKLCIEFLSKQSQRLASDSKVQNVEQTAVMNPDTPAKNPMLRARENLVLTLFNHNDFLTIR